MAQRVTRLSPRARRILQVVGVLFAGTGFLVFASLFIGITSFDTPKAFGGLATAMILSFVLMSVGGFCLQFGFMKPMSEVVATETAGAAEVTAGAIGRGLKEGLGGALGAAVVKVKCRKCGYLESEDAKYCSNCRSPM